MTNQLSPVQDHGAPQLCEHFKLEPAYNGVELNWSHFHHFITKNIASEFWIEINALKKLCNKQEEEILKIVSNLLLTDPRRFS